MNLPPEQTTAIIKATAEAVRQSTPWWQIVAVICSSLSALVGVVFTWIKLTKTNKKKKEAPDA